MRIFWRNLVAIIAIIGVIDGCRGQQVQGRWQGPFPLQGADACTMMLRPNFVFNLTCSGNSWVGEGVYDQTPQELKFTFHALAHEGTLVKHPTPIAVTYRGQGNRLLLESGGSWSRTYGQ